MDFGGDELDQYFGEEACEEFVKGINIDFNDADNEFLKKMSEQCQTQEGQEIFSAVLIENDEMLKQAVFGQKEGTGDFSVFNPLNGKETADLLLASSLAGKLITDDAKFMNEFIQNRFQHFNDQFGEQEILQVTKSLMNQHAKAQQEKKKEEAADGQDQIDTK